MAGISVFLWKKLDGFNKKNAPEKNQARDTQQPVLILAN